MNLVQQTVRAYGLFTYKSGRRVSLDTCLIQSWQETEDGCRIDTTDAEYEVKETFAEIAEQIKRAHEALRR